MPLIAEIRRPPAPIYLPSEWPLLWQPPPIICIRIGQCWRTQSWPPFAWAGVESRMMWTKQARYRSWPNWAPWTGRTTSICLALPICSICGCSIRSGIHRCWWRPLRTCRDSSIRFQVSIRFYSLILLFFLVPSTRIVSTKFCWTLANISWDSSKMYCRE